MRAGIVFAARLVWELCLLLWASITGKTIDGPD
jgi:hypothetical protein